MVGGKVYVAGHRGLVGSALLRRLRAAGQANVVVRTHAELDLEDPAATRQFFAAERPDLVYLAAAHVGGIQANASRPADFIRKNLLIQTNVIHEAWAHGAKALVFFGSSCAYPKHAPQPIREEHLLSGPLEPTNDAYAVAKIAGLTMASAYHRQHGFAVVSLMASNLYGPHDSFDLERCHVLPAVLRRLHDAKRSRAPRVTLWGTGEPRRELLHVDDAAAAAVLLVERCKGGEIVNVGRGEDLTIREIAALAKEIVGYEGEILFDRTGPDGTPRKVLDVSRARELGWTARIPLRAGIEETYRWFLAEVAAREGHR